MRHPVTLSLLAVIAIAVGMVQSGALEAQASGDLFQVQSAQSGTLLAGGDHACGAGSCGSKEDDHKCGSGSCGSEDGDHKCGSGSCGSKEDDHKCGSGSCGSKDEAPAKKKRDFWPFW